MNISQKFDQSSIVVPPQYWEGAYLWLSSWEDELALLRTMKKVAGDDYLIAGRRCFEAAGQNGAFVLCPSDHFFDAEPELIMAFADEARKCVYGFLS